MTLADVLARAQPAWSVDAACATPIALKLQRARKANWFPERGHAAGAAKRICEDCPVRRECLDEAIAEPYLRGIRGGFTENERKRMRAPT